MSKYSTTAENEPDKIIPLDQKCCAIKVKEPIGHEARRIVWRSTSGNSVIDVTIINPGTFFQIPGHREGDDFVIEYNGSPKPPPELKWDYTPECKSGFCDGGVPDAPPQMTNGGGT